MQRAAAFRACPPSVVVLRKVVAESWGESGFCGGKESPEKKTHPRYEYPEECHCDGRSQTMDHEILRTHIMTVILCQSVMPPDLALVHLCAGNPFYFVVFFHKFTNIQLEYTLVYVLDLDF